MASSNGLFSEWFLPEIDGHTVAVYEYGNPTGTPIIVLHGGPGDKSKLKHVTCFDFDKHHIITFDQRGCGSSTPLGLIKNNTTADTLKDMERIRVKLGIDKWYVSGGSWGSTLSLLYAINNPSRVLGLLLTSIFLANNKYEEWAFAKEGGVEELYPDVWQKRGTLLDQYNTNPQNFARDILPRLVSSMDPQTMELVAGIQNWENNLMSTQFDVQYVSPIDITDSDVASVKIMLHYESNNYFLADDEILSNIDKINNIPTIIVHGRYDVLCPLKQAWEIHNSLSNSELIILPGSGHRLTSEGVIARGLAYQKFLLKHQS
ncbi:MAG: prolyl aminopeptidase [bacterium]|nr:alpha/beta fold hydrolase [Candidatus Microgenomates bacterium CPR3]MCQ3944939.1 prolyl aminopeptidase [bacterium]RIK50886.1 MAG: prolyl aminopeptidase [Candidatus Microgenomates bacterium]